MSRPLSGRKILITRGMRQAVPFAEKLHAAGALPVIIPVVGYRASGPAKELRHSVYSHDWIIFTSSNSVRFFTASLPDAADILRKKKVAAIGSATLEALEEKKIRCDLIPDTFRAEALSQVLIENVAQTESILLPQSQLAREELYNTLSAAGLTVDAVTLYHTEPDEAAAPLLAELFEKDLPQAMSFFSPSACRFFKELIGPELFHKAAEKSVCACIGPTTSAEAKNSGYKNIIEASVHTADGLIDTLQKYFGRRHVNDEF